MAASMKMEFAVRMTCQSCVDAIRKALSELDEISVLDISLDREQVLVETALPSSRVQDVIESAGKHAILLGIGPGESHPHSISPLAADAAPCAAVSIVSGEGDQRGVIRFVQLTPPDLCLVEGTVTGLDPGPHCLCIHEYGDLTDGCNGCGDVYACDGDANATPYLAHAVATEGGVAEFRPARGRVQLCDVIGRSVVIHKMDDQSSRSLMRVACGIIARSAGLFENSKRICACSGQTLWDEREALKQDNL